MINGGRRANTCSASADRVAIVVGGREDIVVTSQPALCPYRLGRKYIK